MENEEPNKRRRTGTKLWVAGLTVLAAVVGVVPPIISAVMPNPPTSQIGTMTVSSNVSTTNNYFTSWIDGVKILTGNGERSGTRASSQAPLPEKTPTPLPPPPSAEPEPGAVGRLVSNASLLNEATWGPEVSRVNRLLTFYFHVEATANDDKLGTLDATLTREGKDICTVSLNSKTSSNANGIRAADSGCFDTLPSNASVIYRAKVRASEMGPLVIQLRYVDATKK